MVPPFPLPRLPLGLLQAPIFFLFDPVFLSFSPTAEPGPRLTLGTCQKLAGEKWGWKQREGHNFLRLQKREGS